MAEQKRIIGENSDVNLESRITPTEETKMTLTVEEQAKQQNISRATAYNLTRQKSFYPAFRLGKRTIVSVQALHRWLEEQCQL